MDGTREIEKKRKNLVKVFVLKKVRMPYLNLYNNLKIIQVLEDHYELQKEYKAELLILFQFEKNLIFFSNYLLSK